MIHAFICLLANSLPIALFRFNWNSAAEVQWEFAAPLPHAVTVPTRTMTYDPDNQLASVDNNNVTVDSDGNLTSGPLTNDTFVTYAFDARNRLLNVSGVTNVYDPANNRIGQIYGTNTTVFVVNPNAKLPQVLMRINSGVTNYYVYGAGLLYQVTETASGTNTLTYHYDYRGSTIALTDGNGNVTDRIEYSAYATLTYRAGTNDTPFLFNGRYGVMTDPNGLLYMRARYYNPYLCRFINADPSGFSGGLNFYAYANGNPISYLDPFGLSIQATGDTIVTWLPGVSTTPMGSSSTANYDVPSLSQNNNPNAQAYSSSDNSLSYQAFSDLTGYQLTPGQAAVVAAPISFVLSLPAESAAEMMAAETAPEVLLPANRGFMAGEGGQASVLPGQILDRYGGTGGNFLAPAGTPAAARSLAPGVELRPITSYEVLQPFEAGAGRAAPWFGQPGLGLQFDLGTRTVQDLINAGALRPIP